MRPGWGFLSDPKTGQRRGLRGRERREHPPRGRNARSRIEVLGVLATALLAVILGAALCTLIVSLVARRLGLPIRETLMWVGLIELDIRAVARAVERPRPQ